MFLLTLWIKIQADDSSDDQSDMSMENEIEFMLRETHSFGCNGRNNKSRYQCRMHCRSRNYSSGRCSKSSNYTRCVCYTP
ncbi:unnamed protein product [Rotaria sp. Silwood1]|nr:unnamed protein product [Rotaria sp. Silwood1]